MDVLAVTRLHSRFWDDSTPVLEGAAASRAKAEGLPNPTFSQGVWDLRAIMYRENMTPAAALLSFDRRFADPVRHLTARELVFQRLNSPVPPSVNKVQHRKLSLGTVVHIMVQLPALYRFMDQIGVPRLELLTQEHFDAFARHLTETQGHDRKYAGGTLNILVWLYEARHMLTADRIVVSPWNGTSPWKILGVKKPAENLTPRIPEDVLVPLLRWALLYVNVFSEDIIEALENYTNPELAADYHRRPASDNIRSRELLEEYFANLKRRGAKVPRNHLAPERPNFRAIRAAIGLGGNSFKKADQDFISQATAEIGLGERLVSAPRTLMPETAKPWRPPLGWGRDVEAECRHLTAACYIVCAYLSGMRDSEVQAMKVDCHAVSRDAQGNVIRQYVRSLQYKGKSNHGTERTWVVIEQAGQAVFVMRRLGLGFRSEHNTDLLFVRVRRHRGRGAPSLKASANDYIEEFIEHVNKKLVPWGAVHGCSPIPVDTFQRITTRMFRRTIAWFIANRPFGVVAGMIQYGHMSSQMFEGYAGTSESGFRQEVEAERDCARQGDIVEMYEDWKRGVSPAGPRAEELVNQFEDVREQTDDFPGKVVDQARRDKMLANLRKNLHPGVMADCFFEPANARCLSHLAVGERSDPVAGICDPHCTNACWLKKHLPVWKHSLEDVERLSKRNRISPIQRDILNRRKAEYRSVIKAIREASHDRAQEAR